MIIRSKVGELVCKRRMEKKLTQDAVAQQLGFHKNFLSGIERGVGRLPPKHYKKTARILGINAKELIEAHLADEYIYLERVMK